jgi:hypothetical protein
VEDMRTTLTSFPTWKCSHMNRTLNNAAHRLARVVIQHVTDHIWKEEILDCIRDVILMVQSALSSD